MKSTITTKCTMLEKKDFYFCFKLNQAKEKESDK